MFTVLRLDRRGTTAIEFGLVAPFLLALAIGTIEFGRLGWMQSTLQYAADETSRHLMVDADATDAELEAYVRSHLPSVDGDSVAVDISHETTGGVECVVIEASYAFAFVTPLVSAGTIVLVGRSRTPV